MRGAGHKVNAAARCYYYFYISFFFFWGAPHNKPFEAFGGVKIKIKNEIKKSKPATRQNKLYKHVYTTDMCITSSAAAQLTKLCFNFRELSARDFVSFSFRFGVRFLFPFFSRNRNRDTEQGSAARALILKSGLQISPIPIPIPISNRNLACLSKWAWRSPTINYGQVSGGFHQGACAAKQTRRAISLDISIYGIGNPTAWIPILISRVEHVISSSADLCLLQLQSSVNAPTQCEKFVYIVFNI